MTDTSVEMLEAWIEAALGETPVDLLVRNGRLLNVFTGELYSADVGVIDRRIVKVGNVGDQAIGAETTVVDARNGVLVPGFFDPHFHAGGCHLSPTELARAFLARGTTSTVCDFQEHYAVVGPEAVRFAIDEAMRSGIKLYYLVPIQAFLTEELGISGSGMKVEDMLTMIQWPESVAINEPPPGPVLGQNADALRVIAETKNLRKTYTGHAPEVHGDQLNAYISTGAFSCHESRRMEDALEKLRLGMRTLMREGSALRDMPNLLPLALEYPDATRFMSLCSDEIDPVDLATEGHMDHKIRAAIEAGVPPVTAIQMATINPAEYYNLDDDIGSVAPGRIADIVILEDLEQVAVSQVIANGQLVFRDGELRVERPELSYPEALVSEIDIPGDLGPEDFRIDAPFEEGTAKVRVIGLEDGSAVSMAEEHELRVRDGEILADPNRDVLKIAVVERNRGTGEIGLGFVRGLNFENGALASTYCHPFYDAMVIGTSDSQMATAVNELGQLGGGLVVVSGNQRSAAWALPLVGVFSTEPLEDVKNNFEAMNRAIQDLGCQFANPVLFLSFAVLPTIPEYGLTTKGLFSVDQQKFLPLVLSD